jgi:hypothetical protein
MNEPCPKAALNDDPQRFVTRNETTGWAYQKKSPIAGAVAAAPGHEVNLKASQTVRIRLW